MYETFGWWRRADYIKVHFAESWNEFHHLLIMEVCLQLSFAIVNFMCLRASILCCVKVLVCLPFVLFVCVFCFSILIVRFFL